LIAAGREETREPRQLLFGEHRFLDDGFVISAYDIPARQYPH
jgi:hypothetical protein